MQAFKSNQRKKSIGWRTVHVQYPPATGWL